MMIKSILLLSATGIVIRGLFLTAFASQSSSFLTEEESSQVFGSKGFQCVSTTYQSTCQPIQTCLTKVCGDFGGSNIGVCNGSSQRTAIEGRGQNGCQTAGSDLSSVCKQITDCTGFKQCSTFITMCKTEFDEEEQIWVCKVNNNWSGGVLEATAPQACTTLSGPSGEL